MTASVLRGAEPRYITPRTPGLATYGPQIGQVARAMGRDPMPWQVLAHDVIGEVHDDGRFAHPFVVVTVQRQAGKTDGVATPTIVHRCLYRPRQFAWFTAQTGKDAADKWLEQVEVIRAEGSPLRDLTRKHRASRGSQVLPFVTGSTFAPHPPTRDGLHGKQGDLNVVDEGWAHDQLEGDALQQAIVPIQSTRPFRQTIVMSTEGDARSTWFSALVDRGRAGDPDVALIDYGVPLDFDDPDDLDTIMRHHPAYGYTMDRQAFVDARAQLKAPGAFLRAYGNKRSGAAERVIPLQPWQAAATINPIPPTAPVSLGVAVAEDRSDAAIVACAIVDGLPRAEVIDYRPGVSWVVPRLLQLRGRHGVRAVAIDRVGPAGNVAREYERATTPAGATPTSLMPLTTALVAAACSDVLDRIAEVVPERPGEWRPARLHYRPHEGLDASAAIATKRGTGDGSWLWSRRGSAGSIACLEAMTLAVLAALGGPVAAPAPMIRV